MATKKTKITRNSTPVTIPRSYDIYSIEKRVHNLETGGSTPTPTGGDKYSEDETEIGTWIDGSKVYRKVLTNTSITSMAINSTYDIENVASLNIDKLIRVTLSIKTSTSSSGIGIDNMSAWIDSTGLLKVKASATSWSNIININVIIDYVKGE